MLASSIQLTAKKTHYGLDGSGRDSYINFDNGGNYRGYALEAASKFQRGGYEPSNRGKRINSSYVPISGRPLHYIGDGTGRDCYIVTDDGGLSQGHTTCNFLKTLRRPIPRRQVPKNDVFSKSQMSWRGRNPSMYGSHQRELTERLSSHRQYEDPYKKIRNSFKVSLNSKS